jgi:hypothetical protein
MCLHIEVKDSHGSAGPRAGAAGPPGTLYGVFAPAALVVYAAFASVADRGRRQQAHLAGSRWDMDLIAVALIVGLAVIGLAWIAFVDRI